MFVATALIIKGMGVSAFLSAGADIMSKDYPTGVSSLLTVKARYSSYPEGFYASPVGRNIGIAMASPWHEGDHNFII
jgi:hypothetical protein